jgi:glycosyltransferase involved in cell wall biosynthesis
MRIVNIMFSRIAGGVEQAFVDYCEGLRDRGHQVTAMVYPGAAVHGQLLNLSIHTVAMRNFGEWDMFAINRLRKHLQALNPDIVIAHSNRAYALAKKAVGGTYPLAAVAQNYSTKRITADAEAVMTTTADLVAHIVKQGVPEERVFHIPNMVRCSELPHRGERNIPPVIGTMGRFVTKKGFDVYIDALKILKDRGYQFRAVLGGDGIEGPKLKKQAQAAGLTEEILYFPGWIEDKKAFYSHIDIFCLPSHHEPFGIVLLEAFTYGAPVVATDSEGPQDIITPNYDALIVKKGDSVGMADAIAKLLDDVHLADSLAANAFAKTKTRYSTDVVAERIEQAAASIIARRTQQKKAA